MKTHTGIILIVLFIFASFNLNSQTITIESNQVIFEKSIKPCISSKVDPEKDILLKGWANFLKKNYNIKLKGFGLFSNSDVLSAENISIPNISIEPINFYTNVEETATGSEIKVFSSFNSQTFVDSINYPNEYNALKTMLSNFLIQFTNEYYNDKITTVTNNIKDLNKEKISLLKTIDKNKKKIIKLTNSISVTNVTIKENNEETVKAVEKVSKLNTEKTKLENDNATSLVKIDYIEKKIEQEKTKLEYFKSKRINIL